MIALTDKQKKFLEATNFAFVATVNKDGSPQVTPTWVDTDGKYVFINVTPQRQKAKNLQREPRIAIAVTDQANPYSMISIRGKVVEQIAGKEAEEHIDKLAKKYLGQDKYPYRQPNEKRLLLKIEPTSIAGWGS
ncbi:MAG: PPOX class F420-dependent oxidoreductase [Nitrososphaerota archaeon]|nr:PPOX class F420-dependent oxidoreductase [Nitrososphaerota archaeon]